MRSIAMRQSGRPSSCRGGRSGPVLSRRVSEISAKIGTSFRSPFWAVKRTPRSQLYVGYGADSGPSRGDTCRRTSRPIEASKAAVGYDCFTSIRDVAQTSQMRK